MSLSELAAIRKRLEQKRKRDSSPVIQAVDHVISPQQTAAENVVSAHSHLHSPPHATANHDFDARQSSQRPRLHATAPSISPRDSSKNVQTSTARQLSPGISPAPITHTSDYDPYLSIPAAARMRSSNIPQHWLPHDSRQSLSQDLSQHFVNKGSRSDRPQNFIDTSGDCGDPEFECYLARRDQLISHANAAAPYMAEKCDLNKVDLKQLLQGQEFDVIMIDPPWKEYTERVTVASLSNTNSNTRSTPPQASAESAANSFWDLEAIARLPIIELAAEPCVLFLWCGSGAHVAEGHELLKRWGFHKAEDICWIQTNADATHAQMSGFADPLSVFQRTFEHCIMGIKGREYILRDRDMKSSSGDKDATAMSYRERMELGMVQFVAPGCEVDCFVSELEEEESEARSAIVPPHLHRSSSRNVVTRKPLGFYRLIERFCVGRRRLELFGTEHNIRNGWLTLGSAIGSEWSNLNMERYRAMFERPLELPPPLSPSHFHQPSVAAVATDVSNAVRGLPSSSSSSSSPPRSAAAAAAAAAPFDARVAGHYLTFDAYSEILRPKSPTTRSAPASRPMRRPARPRKGALIPTLSSKESASIMPDAHMSPKSSVDVSDRFPPRFSTSHILGDTVVNNHPRSLSPQPLFDTRSHYSKEGAAARAMQEQQQQMLRQSIYQSNR